MSAGAYGSAAAAQTGAGMPQVGSGLALGLGFRAWSGRSQACGDGQCWRSSMPASWTRPSCVPAMTGWTAA